MGKAIAVAADSTRWADAADRILSGVTHVLSVQRNEAVQCSRTERGR
jgi:hypothetical protein